MESKVALKLVKKVSEKSKKDYFKLYIDFGYREQIVTLKPVDIIAMLDCPMSLLYDMCKETDKPLTVAYLDFNIDKE